MPKRRDVPSPDLLTTGARPRLAPETAAALKHYVYVYVDPRTDAPFYIGKGHGTRVLAHVSGHGNARTTARIEEIRSGRQEPRIDILVHGIEDHETACKVEAAAIDLLAAGSLTNTIRGRGTVEFGRRRLQELDALYGARPVEIVHPSILIRINQRYRPGMSEQELYESTRGVWRLGPRRETARLALAVFQGVVREVYEIGSWHHAGTTAYETRGREEVDDDRRVEFVGEVASPEIRKRYLWRDVRKYLKEKSQNPVCYAGEGMSGRGGTSAGQ